MGSNTNSGYEIEDADQVTNNDVGADVDRDIDEDSDVDSDDSDDSYRTDDSNDSYNEGYWNKYGTNLSEPEEVGGYLADFAFLKNLGSRWTSVEIVYVPTYMLAYWGDADPIPANIIAVPIIQEALAEAAKHLVGNEGWIIRDEVEEFKSKADEWLLKAERRQREERVCEIEHLGLRSFLAECYQCRKREDKFSLEEEGKDGIFRFVADCGKVVSTLRLQLLYMLTLRLRRKSKSLSLAVDIGNGSR